MNHSNHRILITLFALTYCDAIENLHSALRVHVQVKGQEIHSVPNKEQYEYHTIDKDCAMLQSVRSK